MKTTFLTLALAATFGLGLANAQEVKGVKHEMKKEASTATHEGKKEAKAVKHEAKKDAKAAKSEGTKAVKNTSKKVVM